jgi:excisionase family DNA binding protein
VSTATAPSDLLTRDEAAEFLGIKPQTLAVWATTHRYHLPYIRVGTRVRYRRSDLEAFLDRRTVQAGADVDNGEQQG